MSKGTDRDDVDPGGSDMADAVEGDASAGFDEGASGDLLDSDAEIVDREVVEEDGVDAGGEDCVELIEAVDFDFQVGGMRQYSAGGA